LTTRFWLERGVDGFRLDTINFYFHSQGLETTRRCRRTERNASTRRRSIPTITRSTSTTRTGRRMSAFLKRFRALLDEYGAAAAAVGEVGDAQRGSKIVAAYTAGGDVQMCYAFDFLAPEKITPQGANRAREHFRRGGPDGWACWAFSNHDVERHASRWTADEADRDAYLEVLGGFC
jgi:alpha-glucosidase